MPTPKRKRSAKPTDEGPSRKWQPGEKLIIALDFGTTFSGIAYCFVNQRDSKVAAIVDWPGELNSSRAFSEAGLLIRSVS